MSAFQYKKILVVGATSGIGEDLANRILSERPDSYVIAVGRRRANLDKFIEKHGKARASGEEFDITKLGEIEGFAKKITTDHPDLDCIILNSGIQRPLSFTDPSSIDLSTVELETTTNYTSYIYFLKYFLPHFQQKQEGKETAIVFVTSGLALTPISRCGNYCASKAALHHLILVLRKQMKSGPGNIKIIEILPPAVQTELHDAKHQPDIKDGHLMGMPLPEFTDAAWAGLDRGDDNIPVGRSEGNWKAFEEIRLKIFEQMP